MTEAAQSLGIVGRTAERLWAYARAWLRRRMAAATKPTRRNFLQNRSRSSATEISHWI